MASIAQVTCDRMVLYHYCRIWQNCRPRKTNTDFILNKSLSDHYLNQKKIRSFCSRRDPYCTRKNICPSSTIRPAICSDSSKAKSNRALCGYIYTSSFFVHHHTIISISFNITQRKKAPPRTKRAGKCRQPLHTRNAMNISVLRCALKTLEPTRCKQ